MIVELAKALEKSVQESLEDRVAVSFSGGLDSSTLAAIAKKWSEVGLFTAGLDGSEDLEAAGKVAGELGLRLEKIVLDEKAVLDIYAKIYSFYPGSMLKIEIGVPIYACCSEAARAGYGAILFGSGSEELFVGYERYYRYAEEGKDLDAILKKEFGELGSGDVAMIKKIAYRCGLEARFPFCSKNVAELAFSVPLEEWMADMELKKGMLREAGKLLGVPKTALERRKKAAQYGSGVHKVIMRNREELNERFPEKLER